MRALAGLVGLQRVDDIAGLLPGDPRHVVDLGERRLVARDAVAADAQSDRVVEPLSGGGGRGRRLGLVGRRLFRRRLGLRVRRERDCGPDQNAQNETDHAFFFSYGSPRILTQKKPAARIPGMRFKGSQSYVSTEDLTLAVNAAITL